MERFLRITKWDVQHLKLLLPGAIRQQNLYYLQRDAWAKLKQQTTFWQVLPAILTLGLWAQSLQSVDLSRMSDVGLVSVLPPTFFLALFILTTGFCLLAFHKEIAVPILLLYVVSLIVIVHGTPAILYGTLRYSWAWKHVGIVDFIQRHGTVNPDISYLGAYHNWPGFFILSALFTEVGGFNTALNFASWAPVFFNLLDLGALLFIFKSFTSDRRLIWLSIWFFFLGNWVGQDYFSPQAFSYFLHLVIIGICLTWFKVIKLPTRDEIRRWLPFARLASLFHRLISSEARPETSETLAPRQRIGLIIVVLLLLAVVAFSHQLTPFMAITALTALVVFQYCSARNFPLLMAVMTVGWVIFMAVAFLKGNMDWIIQSIGLLTNNFNATLINLADASPGQVFIATMDRSLSALMWGLAMLGCLRRLRQNHHLDLRLILLAFAPMPLLVANSYGGEMLFRVYFFALPFVAFLAAALLYPTPTSGISRRTALMATVLSCIMLTGFCFAYYGKERQYYFSNNEVDAAQYVNSTAPAGSLLLDGSWDWPLQYKNYEEYNYQSLAALSISDRKKLLGDPSDYVARLMEVYPNAYLIITRSQKAHIDMTGLMPAGSLDMIENALVESGRFEIIFARPGVNIFVLVRNTKGGTS